MSTKQVLNGQFQFRKSTILIVMKRVKKIVLIYITTSFWKKKPTEINKRKANLLLQQNIIMI